MASDSEACCESDPNFAVICGFLEKFGVSCGLTNIDFLDLQYMLENNQEVPQQLVDLHVKLLRKARKSVSSERWERAIIKFCHSFCSQDAWEIERFGYKKARLSSKLRILKELLEIQFDYNAKFKNEVNKLSAEELRTQPLGRDQLGHIYWFQSDNSCQIRVYKEDPDEETWALVAKNREGLVNLITQLNDGNTPVENEDSNSLESEKPVVDTGQTDSNSSKAEEPTEESNSKPAILEETPVKAEVEDMSNTPPTDINLPVSSTNPHEQESNGDAEGIKKVEEPIESESAINEYENTVVNLKLKVKKSMIEELNRTSAEEANKKHNVDDEQKLALNLRIKTGPDLTTTTEIKKLEVTGVKEKYIRSDSTSSCGPHRKAVDSAGFDLHTNYLKRPIHDEEDLEEPSYLKRPRLDRPTLLGNKRKKSYSDEEYDEVSDEITEPLMLVKGEGSGHSNKTENGPIISDVIEESVMYVIGEGSGVDCETGNERPQTSVSDQVDSASSKEDKDNDLDTVKDGDNSNGHNKFKVDDHSGGTVSNTVQNSRWDKGKLGESEAQVEHKSNNTEKEGDISKNEEATTSNKSMFFFGPGSLQVKPVISPIKKGEGSLSDDSVNATNDINFCDVPSKTDTIAKEKPRSIVGSRRKSEKPVRKICSNDVDSKEMLLTKDCNCESGDVLKKESKGVELQNDNNPVITTNHVPKSITSSEEKGDSSKSVDNNFIDVPINKTDCINTNSDRLGLPNAKNISAQMDKPKSKLENVLEKINMGKITKKTDGLDLSNKFKNNLMTNTDSKSVDNVTHLVQLSSNIETSNSTAINMGVSVSSKIPSKEPNLIITNDISGETPVSDVCNLPKNTSPSVASKSDHTTQINHIEVAHEKGSPSHEMNLNLKDDLPKLEDNSIVSKPNSIDMDLSPPPLECEVSCLESKSSKMPELEVQLRNEVGNSDRKKVAAVNKSKISNDKNKKEPEKTKTKPENDAESTEANHCTVTRRITRRTRSNADKIAESSDSVCREKSPEENKSKSKQVKKKENQTFPQIDKELEALATNRELRERKVVENKDALKPKVTKVKKGEGKKSVKAKDRKSTKVQKVKDDIVDEPVKMEEIEAQIIPAEIAPPKKLKLLEDGKDNLDKEINVVDTDKNREQKQSDDNAILVEPKCVQKKVALLTDGEKTEEVEKSPTSKEQSCAELDDGDSSDIVIVPDSDPLPCSEEDSKNSDPVMTLATFKIDIDETSSVIPMRVTRKRAAQQSVDTLRGSTRSRTKTESHKKDSGKKAKLKKKRSPDQTLRRSIEDKKLKEISSSDDDRISPPVEDDEETSKTIKERRESNRSSSSIQSSGDSRTDGNSTRRESKEKKPRQIRKTLLGLEISEETENLLKEDTPMGVRQSRRIAQIKIKEEAERRKLEELTLQEMKDEKMKKGKKDIDKDYKSEKKRQSKHVHTEDETTTGEGESDEKKKRKKKRKDRDPRKHFDVYNPWKSSSGSSSSVEEEEEEEIEEDEDHPLVLKSDHEFSPESDLEGVEVQPLKRARTARKESDTEEEIDDCPCQKCGQSDHPEWILLCDSCDSGWHCSCLRPALLVIPEGDWFCPPCQHATLVKKLETQLVDYDKRINKKVMETRRKERLAYVGISLDNVLPSKEPDEHRARVRYVKESNSKYDDDDGSEDSESDDSDSESESGSSSESDSEPIYQLRKRRQAHSYRFNDYDDLINSAIQDELDAVKGAGNQGRGKDISTIVNAEKQEAEARLKDETAGVDSVNPDDQPTDLTMKSNPIENLDPIIEPLPPVVPPDYDKRPDDEESDEEIVRPVRKIISKKKHRKLNSLDVSSGDDAESDEDFKGSSSDSDEEEDDYAGSESSDDLDVRKPKSHKGGPIRRSTRARTSRYDRDFINDDSDSGSSPRRKKNRFGWDETESEESDRSWGRRKRRTATVRSRKKPSDNKVKRPKKKKKEGEESDPEVFKRRPNIKFDPENDKEIGRRTRGKKINYLEALGSDSDDDGRRKPPRIEESDDEYAVHEDEELQQRLQNENDSDESGVENVLRDLPLPLNPRPKPKGRGKAGLKIPRKPKDPNLDLFPSMIGDLPPTSTMPTEMPVLQQALESHPLVPPQIIPPPLIMDPMLLHDPESQDLDDEPNPIEQINKNVEQMNEQEMEKMMEEEDYANRQLQLVALQIEKEKKRKEREVQRLEKLMQMEPKIPKKRGRKPKNQMLNASTNLINKPFVDPAMLMSNNAELSEPPGISLPMFSELAPTSLNADGSPKKRRGRDSPLHGSKLGIAAPPQPFSQSQPAPSVITRMLQSQPGQTNFSASNVSKYFGGHGDSQLGPYHPGAAGPRGPYQQQSPVIPHFPVIRSGPPPLRLHSPGAPNLPPMYHPHRPMDPSPSGGGPVNVTNTNRDRQSPAVVSPSSQSPLSKGDPTPPPYTRPPVGHFSPVSSSSTSATRPLPIISSHLQQQHRPSNMSQFHAALPPNYHYGSYPPPPPLTPDEGQSSPSYSAPPYPEQYPEGGPPIQAAEPSPAPVTVTAGVVGKPYDEGEEGGEFVGLVSYFSSQREDDLDT